MTDVYMADEDYYRLVAFIMDSFLGSLLQDHRDVVMLALGEKAGIWPEYCRREQS